MAYANNGQMPVLCMQVAWHPVDAGLLVSSSMDGSVVAFKTDGTKVKVGAASRSRQPVKPHALTYMCCEHPCA
jgi:hypothetical protein